MLPIVIIFVETSNKKTLSQTKLLHQKMPLPQHSKCGYRNGRDRITHIFTIPFTSTNHVSWSKFNGIDVHIRRDINSVPNVIDRNDVFDARIISLKYQYPVEQLEYGNYIKFQNVKSHA